MKTKVVTVTLVKCVVVHSKFVVHQQHLLVKFINYYNEDS